MIAPEELKALNTQYKGAAPEAVLAYMLDRFGGSVAFASSLGAEDQVITHMLAGISKEARIFTLDTGRLFPETYDLLHTTNTRYGIKIAVMFPDSYQVEKMVSDKGINLFYESIDNRKHCCAVRKLEPLARAMKGLDAWITGLRREQSSTRNEMQRFEWDEPNGMLKVNPLIDWHLSDIWDFIRTYKVPYNPLHDKGYPSIGCQPCTREVLPGEDVRAGRWWWERPDTRECGLHR